MVQPLVGLGTPLSFPSLSTLPKFVGFSPFSFTLSDHFMKLWYLVVLTSIDDNICFIAIIYVFILKTTRQQNKDFNMLAKLLFNYDNVNTLNVFVGNFVHYSKKAIYWVQSFYQILLSVVTITKFKIFTLTYNQLINNTMLTKKMYQNTQLCMHGQDLYTNPLISPDFLIKEDSLKIILEKIKLSSTLTRQKHVTCHPKKS